MSDPSELERLRAEVARLSAELESERRHAAQWRRVAEERRVTLERFRQQPLVRLVFRVAQWVLPPLRRARRRADVLAPTFRRVRRAAGSARAAPARLTATSRERRLRQAVVRLPSPPRDRRVVSLIVLTRDGRDRLTRLLPALRATGHPHLEIVVVDNASDAPTRDYLARQDDVRVVRLEQHTSFSAANNTGAGASTGEVLCFLNDDVEPLHPDWLGHLLACLDGDVVVAGAHLVYARRRLLAGRARDLTVQHLGIDFEPVPAGVPRAVNVGGFEPRLDEPVVERGAVTAACLAVRRDVFEDVGGFDESYEFGVEDVDLCWRLRRHGRIVAASRSVLLHTEGATRLEEDLAHRTRRQQANWTRLAERFGPDLRRAVALDRLHGRNILSQRPYTVAITLTREQPEAGYGDWYTAHDLGAALARLGWRVRYLERYRDSWYEVPEDVDAVISLLDVFDVRRVARPGLTTVAWVRNWAERWASHEWFDDYDLVVASSRQAADLLAERTRHRPLVLPLATDAARFRPDGGARRQGAVVPANHWGEDRGVPELLEAVPELELYGKGWERVPGVTGQWRGPVPYERLPELYADSLVVVDVTSPHTATDGSVNARVFDAAAAGAVVVSNQPGVHELFGDLVPVFDGPDGLATLLKKIRHDPAPWLQRADELREVVQAEHTWDTRAHQVRDLLVHRESRPRFALLIAAPDRNVAPTWGDHHLAEALARELRAAGCPTEVVTADQWDGPVARAADVTVHLKGRSRVERTAGQLHVVWSISHPDELTVEECDEADLVLAASARLAETLRRRTSTPVRVLPQATDERRFRPHQPDPRHRHDVVFVGNSRFVERPIVHDALAAGLDLAVYGSNWDGFVPPRVVRERFVPNQELPLLYSSAEVVLNDHWPDMRDWGIVSNRVFDALACGATVVSDELPELRELFGDAVATYHDAADLRSVVEDLLADPERRRAMGTAGRAAVLADHTFRHRAHELLSALQPLLAEKGLDGSGVCRS